MDFSTAFRYFRDDETWKRKFGIAAILGVISALLAGLGSYFVGVDPTNFSLLGYVYLGLLLSLIPSTVLAGFAIDISRNVRDGEKQPLADWSFGRQFKQGASVSIAAMLYAFPVGAVMGCMLVMAMIPLAIGLGEGSGLATGLGVMGIISAALSTVAITALLGFFTSAVQVNYIRHNTFASCFQWQNIKFVIQNRWKKLAKIMLFFMGLALVVGLISGGLGAISPLAGLIGSIIIGLTYTPLATFMQGHLYGQVAGMVDLDKLEAADRR